MAAADREKRIRVNRTANTTDPRIHVNTSIGAGTLRHRHAASKRSGSVNGPSSILHCGLIDFIKSGNPISVPRVAGRGFITLQSEIKYFSHGSNPFQRYRAFFSASTSALPVQNLGDEQKRAKSRRRGDGNLSLLCSRSRGGRPSSEDVGKATIGSVRKVDVESQTQGGRT